MFASFLSLLSNVSSLFPLFILLKIILKIVNKWLFSFVREPWPGVCQTGRKTLTLLLKENRPTAQRVMETCLRGSASPEPPPASVKALRVRQRSAANVCHANRWVFWRIYSILFHQIHQTWSEPPTMTNLHPWPPREMPPHLNRSWTSPAQTPLTMRATPKTKPAEIQIKTSPIDPNAAAVTKPTTSTWNAPPRAATHWVKLAHTFSLQTLSCFQIGIPSFIFLVTF